MSEEKSLVNINLEGLSKPAIVLIEKISDAIGGLARPWQSIRVAEAEAEAREIQARSEMKVTALEKRAIRRFLKEEAKKQSNIEAITEKALPLLEHESAPQNVADDWITNFFEKSRIVSDADMQQLFAKVLAGEANTPGRFAKKTINMLADFEQSDAEAFTRLCNFSWVIRGMFSPLIYTLKHPMYESNGIDFNTLAHLEHLGLIKFAQGGFLKVELPKTITVAYHGKLLDLTFPYEQGNQIGVGHVSPTRAGEELGFVCKSNPVEGFFDYVYDRLADQSLLPKRGS